MDPIGDLAPVFKVTGGHKPPMFAGTISLELLNKWLSHIGLDAGMVGVGRDICFFENTNFIKYLMFIQKY